MALALAAWLDRAAHGPRMGTPVSARTIRRAMGGRWPPSAAEQLRVAGVAGAMQPPEVPQERKGA